MDADQVPLSDVILAPVAAGAAGEERRPQAIRQRQSGGMVNWLPAGSRRATLGG